MAINLTSDLSIFRSKPNDIEKQAVLPETKKMPTTNAKFGSRGEATLNTQLGIGSPFQYTKDSARQTKIFSKGWNETTTYSEQVNSINVNNSVLAKKASEQNSPSAIEEQYKKFSLRDEAFNTSYINQPYIVRGIQRREKQEPQRWGAGIIDDGFIRGGITTAATRAAFDTARIAQWLASPKGLLWIVKQVGLGLSNPRVETAVPTPIGQTRIQPGINILPSIAGTAFGLHFTRHGIPFLNEKASYENVMTVKNSELFYDKPGLPNAGTTPGNRLIALRSDLIQNTGFDEVNDARKFLTGNDSTIIRRLSYFGGPGSVYGIGTTTIRRYVNTTDKSIERAKKANALNTWEQKYNISSQYAGRLFNAFNKTYYLSKPAFNNATQNVTVSNGKITTSLDTRPIDEIDSRSGSTRDILNQKSNDPKYYPGTDQNKEFDNVSKDLIKKQRPVESMYAGLLRAKTNHDHDTNEDLRKATLRDVHESTGSLQSRFTSKSGSNGYVPGSTETSLNNSQQSSYQQSVNNTYLVLAYNQIPNNRKSFRDFRELTKTTDSGSIAVTGKRDGYYASDNLEDGKGFSKPAATRITDATTYRTKPNKFLKSGNEFKGIAESSKTARTILATDNYHGDKVNALDIGDVENIDSVYPNGMKDLIKFYFQDGSTTDNNLKNVMVFRATITGFTDTFSPSWDRIDIMGRPDGAYIYTSFDRSISFSFMVAAMTRSEMIPIWRKLNYLATYTMPEFATSKPSGPFMRITLGDLFQQTPGFIESLTYTVPDESPWDIGEQDTDNPGVEKQLPMAVEVSMTFKIVADYRPRLKGRAYSLSKNGSANNEPANWLSDALTD